MGRVARGRGESMGNEQRQHQRYPVEVAGEIGFKGETVAVSTQNLSAGGVGLIMEHPVPDGATPSLTLFLTQDGIEDPDQDPFEARGAVRWSAERDDGLHLIGVQFGELSPLQQHQLETFLTLIG